MSLVAARLLPPRENYSGNVVWQRVDLAGHEQELLNSLASLRDHGYWASAFPEGDGITFQCAGKQASEILLDFQACFPWLMLTLASSRDWALEAAELEQARPHRCTVMLPLTKILIDQSFEMGEFRFVCPYDMDPEPQERLANFQEAYIQFEADIDYRDLLRASTAISFSDALISQCLTLAERGMDLIRFEYGSFLRPEYTPNPAGLKDDGFYGVEIIPGGYLPLAAMSLEGLVAPLTTSNNHLGPDVTADPSDDSMRLADLLQARNDELADAIRRTLRACRQSFYSLGDESRFLNLVFALDGLVGLDKSWTGWKQRTYVAALLSGGCVGHFRHILRRYDELYARVRNPLVHGGHDFYQLGEDPRTACEFLHEGIKDVINLITRRVLTTKAGLQALVLNWLLQPDISHAYTEIISSHPRGGAGKIPSWR